MISVTEALSHVFALARPLQTETISLRDAAGRVLAAPVVAGFDQPPFAVSTMDGYAVANLTVSLGDRFTVIGESAAGHGFDGSIGSDQTVRIFTGAPVPKGTRRVLIQEDMRRDEVAVIVSAEPSNSLYIRNVGSDFKVGHEVPAGRRLSATDLALIASMDHSTVEVTRKPVVALIATGDELVMPGDTRGRDQIIASNAFALAAMVDATGGIARILPIANDTVASLNATFDLAQGADLIVTIGGASVGYHDLVATVAKNRGLKRSFYKIAMRPGKPLMAGRLGESALLGVPGNPVSSIVCGRLFMLPMIEAMLGLPAVAPRRKQARLVNGLPPNGQREHYMRARLDGDLVTVSGNQDSALLTVLSDANALVVRPVDDPARNIGETVEVLDL